MSDNVSLQLAACRPLAARAGGGVWALWSALLLLVACVDTGAVKEAVPAPSPDPNAFSCNAEARPPETPLRRLTMRQYQNTLRDLAGWALQSPELGKAVLQEVRLATRSGLPEDVRESVPQDVHGSFRRLDQTLQGRHVQAFYEAGDAMGMALTGPGRLARVVGTCAADGDPSNDETCLAAFIERFGSRALRHPLDAAEKALYREAYGTSAQTDPGRYADLIALMLNVPDFVFMVETGTAPAPGDRKSVV